MRIDNFKEPAMETDEPQGSISQLTGMMGFIHRSGALAPFQAMMIITGVIFTLAAFQRLEAYCQPLCFWVLCLLAVEAILTLIIGTILAIYHPECLLSEMYQQSIKEMEAKQKNALKGPDSSHMDDSSEEGDGSEEGV